MKKAILALVCLATMMAAGTGLKAQEVVVTLSHGWNWVSYPNAVPMGVSEALGDFVPAEGDMIQSKFNTAGYHNGRWRGSFTQFIPGRGLMYYSTRTEEVELVFASPTSTIVATAEATDITTVSAVVGGTVTINEGNHIFARGVCWGTEPNPTIDDSHQAGDNVAGSQSFTLDGLNIGTTYYIRAYAATDSGLAYGNEVTFTTEGGGDTHAYVDLGLPSGTLWATCNIGANSPEDYGDYFA